MGRDDHGAALSRVLLIVSGLAAAVAQPDGKISIQINPSKTVGSIPASFLGMSREYSGQTYWDKNPAAFKPLFDVLGSSPVVRVGGHSQDVLQKVPDAAFLSGLVQMHVLFNFRFILGVPLFPGNPALVVAMLEAFEMAFKDHPEAVLAIELGNEPDFWPQRAGGYTSMKAGQFSNFKPGWQAYRTYFQAMAAGVSGCGGAAAAAALGVRPPALRRLTGRIITGPAWGDLTIKPSELAAFAEAGSKCYLKETSLHFYHAGQGSSVKTIIDNSQLFRAIASLKELVKVSNSFGGLPLRISESNSISGGGESFVSNSFGGTLWTAEIALEFAKAGAAGIHFHDGHVGSATNDIPAYVFINTKLKGGDPNQPYPEVFAPFFAFILISRATNRMSAASFADYTSTPESPNTKCQERLKIYPLLPQGQGQRVLNVVMLNKGGEPGKAEGCDVQLQMPAGAAGTGSGAPGGAAELVRLLPGPEGLTSTAAGITFGGQSYFGTTDGLPRGSFQAAKVAPVWDATARQSSYRFRIPAASALVLQIPLL